MSLEGHHTSRFANLGLQFHQLRESLPRDEQKLRVEEKSSRLRASLASPWSEGAGNDLDRECQMETRTMRSFRLAALAGAVFAANVEVVKAVDLPTRDGPADFFPIELPPFADAILNGNTDNLHPRLVEALNSDFSFALGVSIGS